MTTLGALSAGLLVVVLLVGGGIALIAALTVRSQRRLSRGPEQPRTVADLVRMRETAAAEAASHAAQASAEASVDTAPVDDPPLEAVPVDEAPVDAVPVGEAPVEMAPVEMAAVDEAPVEAAAPEVVDQPVADARRPKAAAEDTPWARAARMADPLAEWTASARAARGRDTPTGSHGPPETPTPETAPETAQEKSLSLLYPSDGRTPKSTVKLFGAVAEPDVAAQAAAAAKAVAAKPSVAADPVDEPTVELDDAAPPVAHEPEEPTVEIVDVAPPEEPTVELHGGPAPTRAEPPGPVASAELSGRPWFGLHPTPARIAGRVRRSPADTAAEQAAADLALLRTFGVAGPGRTAVVEDTEVELEGCVSDVDEPGAGSAQPVTFRVVGRDGKGVPGASVTLLDDHGRETGGTVADDHGAGTLTARRSGGYMLVTAADGYQPGAITIAVTDGPVDAEIPLTRSATIAGTVSSEDGPVVGARLVLVQDGEIVDTAQSAEDGAYRFGDVAAGEYGLSVTAPECEPTAAVLRIGDEADLCHDVDLDPVGLPADGGATGDVMIFSPLMGG